MLAKNLGIDHVNLDLSVVEKYRYQIGWQEKESGRLRRENGNLAHCKYNAQFSLPLIARLMEEYPSAILDCGGDELVGWTDEQRKEIKNGLADLELKLIAAILPSSVDEKNRSYLAVPDHWDLNKWNKWLLENPAYWQIASKVFHIDGRGLEHVTNAITGWVLE